MAAKPKKLIGTCACLVCGVDVPVREAENGTLDVSCKYCDFPAYVKKGTEAYDIISASITRKALPAEPAPVDPTAKSDAAGSVTKPAAPVKPVKGKMSWMP